MSVLWQAVKWSNESVCLLVSPYGYISVGLRKDKLMTAHSQRDQWVILNQYSRRNFPRGQILHTYLRTFITIEAVTMLRGSFRKSPLDVCGSSDQVLNDNMKTTDITTDRWNAVTGDRWDDEDKTAIELNWNHSFLCQDLNAQDESY